MENINSEQLTFFQKFQYISKFIFRAFLLALFFFLITFFFFFLYYFGDLFYNTKLGNHKNPLFNAYVIVSPSMIPTIKVKDAIVVKRVEKGDLNIGDIITFTSSDPSYSGMTVTHRIVGKQLAQTGEYVYRTKGDNNTVEDRSLVRESDVFGRVILKIPKLGYIQQFLTNPVGFFLAILIPVFIIFVFQIKRLVSIAKKKEELKG